MKYVDDLSVTGHRVLLRVDCDGLLEEAQQPLDAAKLRRILPTLTHLLERGAAVILASHCSPPRGKTDCPSLQPIADKLAEITGREVRMGVVGADARDKSAALTGGHLLVLENLSLFREEERNDLSFARELSTLAEMYVNDAFVLSDRVLASTTGVAPLYGIKAGGLLLKKELEYYQRAIVDPKRPLCVALGGAKAAPRIEVLRNLAKKADKILIGGALANTFLAAQGAQLGRSVIERELYPQVLEIIGMLARRDCKVYFPVDFRIGGSPKSRGLVRDVTAQEVPPDSMVLDIGPATSILFNEALTNAETILWNGPMGTFENEDYATGTTDLVQSLAAAHGLKVAGGAATEAALRMMELEHKFDHISTGGNAFLSLLEGGKLPGLEALGWRPSMK